MGFIRSAQATDICLLPKMGQTFQDPGKEEAYGRNKIQKRPGSTFKWSKHEEVFLYVKL